MPKNRAHFYVLIIAWSLLVHLPGVTSPLLDYQAHRQCQTASMARNYVRDGMHFLNPEVDYGGSPKRSGTEFPIYTYLLALLYKVFGVHEVLGRLLSMVFAAWGAIYLFLFVRERLDERTALWSALVLCSLPDHIYFTRTVMPEPMALWGLLGFLYYTDRWLSQEKPGWWVLALVTGSIATLLKLAFLYLLGPLWAFLGFERYGWKMIVRVRYLLMMGLIVVFTWLWYRYTNTAPVDVLPLTPKEQMQNLAPILTWNLWRAQFISRVPELIFTYSGLLFAWMGYRLIRKQKFSRFLLAWGLICVVYVALLGEYGLIHRYTLLPLAPLAAILIACGIVAALDLTAARPAWRRVVFILIIGIPLHAALRIKHWYRIERKYLYRAHDVLVKISSPSDLVLTMTAESPVLLYYIDRYGYAISADAWTPALVDDLIKNGIRFILIPTADNYAHLRDWAGYMAHRGTLVVGDPDYLLYRIAGSMPVARHG